MEIGLHDGTSRIFCPGQHFYSADTLPTGAVFDSSIHGHWSRQTGTNALVTLFLRSDEPLNWLCCGWCHRDGYRHLAWYHNSWSQYL